MSQEAQQTPKAGPGRLEPEIQEALKAGIIKRAAAVRLQVAEVEQDLGWEEMRRLQALPRHEKQAEFCNLMVERELTANQAAHALGVPNGALSSWFTQHGREMARLMGNAVSSDAVRSIPQVWNALKKLLRSGNQETARKACLDMLRTAGLSIDAGAGGQRITVNTEHATFNTLSVTELDKRIMQIAGNLGPDAVKLAEGEIRPGRPSTAAE